jgi:hypothetical protein
MILRALFCNETSVKIVSKFQDTNKKVATEQKSHAALIEISQFLSNCD